MFYSAYTSIDQLAPLEIACLIQQHTNVDYTPILAQMESARLMQQHTNIDQLVQTENACLMKQHTSTDQLVKTEIASSLTPSLPRPVHFEG